MTFTATLSLLHSSLICHVSDAVWCIRLQSSRFVDMVLSRDRPAPTPSNPTPFADAFKNWATFLVGGWVDLLEGSFTAGINGVHELVKLAFQAKIGGVNTLHVL
jgi:hypothetical protein